jgi:type IV secretory pathway TrbD component
MAPNPVATPAQAPVAVTPPPQEEDKGTPTWLVILIILVAFIVFLSLMSWLFAGSPFEMWFIMFTAFNIFG